ncbi:MAG: hypothetical protein G01um101433_156 [Parcubacteria group bacterium Gr01-1014_33]|nr:MAG: hypothetical protein G01um101433_156 [Parcubacteria group bacterium Gr01-1014_33]
MRQNGFSLIEILLAAGILAVLATLAFSAYTGYRTGVEAEEEINKIRSTLREAQGNAIGFLQNSQWGVRFSNPTVGDPLYELFYGVSYPGTIQETTYLSSRFTFTSPVSGSSRDILFEKRSGRSTSAHTITITIQPRSGTEPIKNVSVTQEGNIE